MIVLIFYVAFALIFRSIMAIGWSIQFKKLGIANWGWLLFTGIIGALLSFLLLWNPVFAGLTIVYYVGFAFISVGISQTILSLRLRKWKKYLKESEV